MSDIAEKIFPSAFEAILAYWRANAPRLTKMRLDPDIHDWMTDEILAEDVPVLSVEGHMAIRERADRGYDCWCGTVGEHPVGLKVFTRIEAKGEWHPDGTAKLEAWSSPGDGSEGGEADPLVDIMGTHEADGYATFLLSDGRVIED